MSILDLGQRCFSTFAKAVYRVAAVVFPPRQIPSKFENYYYTILRKSNWFRQVFPYYSRIYFIGAFVYTVENYNLFEQEIQANRLGEFLNNCPYDARKDNVELFLIENDKTNARDLLVLLDPFELFEPASALKIIHNPLIQIENVNMLVIFSK